MRVSREISLGSSLHRASTDALIIETLFYMLPIADWSSKWNCACARKLILGEARWSPPTESLRSREISKNHG